MQKDNAKKPDHELVYQLEGKPSLKVALPLGLQHVLSMFVGNIAPILVVIGVLNGTGNLAVHVTAENSVKFVQATMLASGLTTMLQLYPLKIGKLQIGANLPIVMGTSFSFVPIAITVGSEFGFAAIFGCCLVGSFVAVALGFLYPYLKKVFSEAVIGSVLIAIGIDLLGPGVAYFAGGEALRGTPEFGSMSNLGLAFFVFFITMGLQKWGAGIFKMSSILIAIILGYVAAIFMGKVNFSIISDAAWFGLPIPPISVTEFEFHWGAIASFALIFIVVGLETIGNANGITVAAFDRKANEKETSGAILADGCSGFLASLLNAMPNTAFGQNAGIVAMTKIVNKWCIAVGAFILILSAFVPKLGAIFRAIPDPVLGGAILTVFAMITINGIKLISQGGFSNRNILILGVTIGIGYGLGTHQEAVAQLPVYVKWIFENSIASVCLVSIFATLLFPESKDDKKESEI